MAYLVALYINLYWLSLQRLILMPGLDYGAVGVEKVAGLG